MLSKCVATLCDLAMYDPKCMLYIDNRGWIVIFYLESGVEKIF